MKLLVWVFAVIIIFSGGCRKKAPETAAQVTNQKNEREWVPEIVPYLDSHPSKIDGQGTATLSPPGPFPVGSRQNFTITFTVGEAGITPRGFILLQVSPWWGWSEPQTLYPGREGYTTVTSSPAPSSLKAKTLPLDRILVYALGRGFAPGQVIIFKYDNARIDRFAEAKELFQIFVDADGDGHSACIKDPPHLRTLAREAARLNVVSPSQVVPDQKIKVRAAPLDQANNWSTFPAGKYRLSVSRDSGTASEEKIIPAPEGEKNIDFEYRIRGEGVYFFEIKGPLGLSGRSNVTFCRPGRRKLNLYFGDIHGHSRQSDGTGTPEDYYRYARLVSGLEIAALTDHAAYGTIPIKGRVWDRIKKAANDAYLPHHFVTLVGFEWTNWKYGHRNVYYRGGDGPIFRSIDPASDTPRKLWELLVPYRAMTIAHHVGGGPIGTDWSIPPGSKERLVEISSIHGSSEYYGCPGCIYRPVKGDFVRDALGRGYRLGIIGSGDNHDGHPGQRTVGTWTTGIMGVYCSELTRESVWDALWRRQVYGTSGPKIILNFRVADSPMGSEVKWPASGGGVPIAVRAVACDRIDYLEIIRNGESFYREEGRDFVQQVVIEDSNPPPGTSWYYARVVQKDGNMAWSSPVWVTIEKPD